MLNILYVYLFVVAFKGTMETRQLVQAEITLSQAGNANQLQPALALKKAIMTRYLALVIVYFSYEILLNGIIPGLMTASQRHAEDFAPP